MKIQIISSNIRFDNPADGINAWPHRREILTQTLLSHDPDIVATQEGRRIQLFEFAQLMNFQMIDEHRKWIEERMYPTFFVKKDRWDILGSYDHWLSTTPEIAGSASFGSAFPRLVTWLKAKPKDSDLNFMFINTHLDHVKSETRIEQIKVLVSEVKKHFEPNLRVIIMGDFNDSPQSEVRKILTESFPSVLDSWAQFNQNEETSHHAFNGEDQNGSRIDWILSDETLKIENCFLDKSTVDGKYPSDHFPVVCTIKP